MNYENEDHETVARVKYTVQNRYIHTKKLDIMLVLMFDAFKTGNLGQLHPLADMIYCSITLLTEELTNLRGLLL